MKIGFILDSCSRNAGGLFESVRRLAQSQTTDEQQTVIYSVEDEFSEQDAAEWLPIKVCLHERRFPASWGFAPGLKTGVLDAGLDLLMTHGLWQYCSVVSVVWHKLTRRPHIINPHGMLDPWALRHSWWKKKAATLLYESVHLRSAAAFRALCTSEAESIRKLGLKNPIAVIPNGIDLPELDRPCSNAWDEWAHGRKVLLYLGRLHPKKNLGPLIQAWAKAQNSSSRAQDWVLVIAGWDQGGYQATLIEQARELGLFRSVHFPGPVFAEAKASAYQSASAFVLPSLSEGLPMVILEAWAYAKPVLMTDECNLPEGFSSDAALRITPDVDGIRAGLENLFNSTDQDRSAMGWRGRQLCAERFTWEKIGAQMREVNQWVLGGGSSPSCLQT